MFSSAQKGYRYAHDLRWMAVIIDHNCPCHIMSLHLKLNSNLHQLEKRSNNLRLLHAQCPGRWNAGRSQGDGEARKTGPRWTSAEIGDQIDLSPKNPLQQQTKIFGMLIHWDWFKPNPTCYDFLGNPNWIVASIPCHCYFLVLTQFFLVVFGCFRLVLLPLFCSNIP